MLSSTIYCAPYILYFVNKIKTGGLWQKIESYFKAAILKQKIVLIV